jgi:hypothetical protein
MQARADAVWARFSDSARRTCTIGLEKAAKILKPDRSDLELGEMVLVHSAETARLMAFMVRVKFAVDKNNREAYNQIKGSESSERKFLWMKF